MEKKHNEDENLSNNKKEKDEIQIDKNHTLSGKEIINIINLVKEYDELKKKSIKEQINL